MSKMRRLLFVAIFIIFFLVGEALTQVGRYRDVFRSVCELTADHFYKDDQRLRDWFGGCLRKAARIPVTLSADQLLNVLQDQMDLLEVSHFSVYSPAEDRKLWTGQTVDTGIRSRYIEDHLVIYDVLPESAAARAGVRPGDEILALPGISQATPWGAEHRAGVFSLRRAGRALKIEVAPSPLNIDFSPQIEALTPTVGRLTISSFRSEFFDAEDWRATAARLKPFRHLIIDVRENAGGNFVAMLRALSTFECGPRRIGRLVQPRLAGPDKEAFDDDTDDAHQIDELAVYHSLGLKTFSGYGCFSGRVTVLISSNTSSVAEIFADSFLFRPDSRVWGQPSAGDVVLAVWYDLPALGPGFSVSVPEAIYLNRKDQELEGRGVYPQKELYYDLKLALQGKDTWLLRAMNQ